MKQRGVVLHTLWLSHIFDIYKKISSASQHGILFAYFMKNEGQLSNSTCKSRYVSYGLHISTRFQWNIYLAQYWLRTIEWKQVEKPTFCQRSISHLLYTFCSISLCKIKFRPAKTETIRYTLSFILFPKTRLTSITKSSLQISCNWLNHETSKTNFEDFSMIINK